ncbi:MAG: OmpA family protein [Myxococcales bacterium]|nr:OmpA family protein [Myxococcales bacterium]
MRRLLALALVTSACAHAAPPPPHALRLDRVVLFQNGIGHFERRGALPDRHLRLVLRPHEVDDVIKTLTVVDRDGQAQQVAAVLPTPDQATGDRVVVDIELSRPVRDLIVSYAVPTAAWKTTYRVAMPERAGGPLLFQAWAMIDNVSEESWDHVQLALATGAPLSFATDLRTPHFVPRPDATGALVAPTATAVVTAARTRGGASDEDHDGIADVDDQCPLGAEDRDGFDEDDGCPDPDNDRDRIPDVDDRCPDEPEVWNGYEDDDGCPDRGRVIVTDAQIQILERIYFGAGATTPAPSSAPILDAIAATLVGNPEIQTVQLAGHAAAGEADPWGLSARRAAAIRAALADRGVQQQLTVRPFGDTSPIDRDPSHNRRVEFAVIERRAERGPSAPTRTLDQRALASTAGAAGTSVEVAGTARWQLADRVTVPRGASTLVSVLSREVTGAGVLLFRPDAGTPGSARHPYRAARIALPAELTVEPGPVAVFAEGSFAGEGVLARTPGGQVTYVPYAVDGGTSVTVEVSGDERPQRLVAVARGIARVQNARVRTTRYTIAASATAPATIYLRHVPTVGYQLGELPPGSERGDDDVLIALPIVPGGDSVLVVEERQPVTRELQLLDAATDLAAYVDGADLPPAVLAAVGAVVSARAALADAEAATAAAQTALADVTEHNGDLERSLTTVAKLPGAEAAQLRARLLKSLTELTARADQLARTIATHRAAEVEARVRLQTAIEALGLEQLTTP